ncbi:ABC transporter ATP-binding protein [Flavisphingopyxis soli]|uniref:ABC transporter ATP-binding protein n=1 Tax=Flavisphingopyxis soli TaxID=2601267 RepID=UPI001F00B6FB|nr:ATP-binding cassette domain-containing protein [Sphingorhabdus soli]
MASTVIEASGLVKYFGDFRAVDGIDISVPQGSVYGILGPNGAGKTTTIRMLLGIIDPDEGTRSLLGSANPRSVSDRVGYLPEERGLYPGMKACEVIAFMGALRGLDWSAGRKRGAEMMEQVGLSRVVDEKIRKMSKGMAQMVQLIGSIVHRPELIVLDEPFSGLDPVNQGRLEALIGEERARGATIVFSTHVMAHAERLCDRLAIIAGAKRRFEGTVDEARGQLPLEVRYTPGDGAARLDGLLPAEATRRGDSFRFPIEDHAVAAWLTRLVDSGHGVASLSIERPGLHDAFVHIVGSDAVRDDAAMGDAK